MQRWAPRTFLVQNDRRISFGEFFATVDAARNRLQPLGIQPRERVMLLTYNSPDWVVALWAIWSLGAVPVLGNRWWSVPEATHSLDLTAPRVVITDAAELVTDERLDRIRELVDAKYGFFTKVTKLLGTIGGIVKRNRIPYGDRGVVVTLPPDVV